MTIMEFALPDLGEGLTESELVEWHVAVGDLVELNQPIAEVETAKAVVQLPSPFAGVIARLYAEPGSTVTVGAPFAAFEVQDDPDKPSDSSEPDEAGSDVDAARIERNSVLVGYGPAVEGTDRPKRKARGGQAIQSSVETVEEPAVEQPAIAQPAPARAAERPRSTPPVRKLAADLGVDLDSVMGSGEGGMITRDDVREAASAPASSTTGAGERETRIPVKGVRKHTAAAMVASAFTAPHVTEFLTVDVTPTMELLETLRGRREFAGIRVTLLAIVAKAMCIAARRTPEVNSRWDDPAGEIVQFGYVNLGIAVATPRGLMVPNIKDADALSLADLAGALGRLAETARAGETTPADLAGGTISVTNVGVFGIDAGTPILNPGEAAILATGAVRRLPWEFKGEVALREVMTLSLSFDHRLVDGEQGSRFLTDVGSILSEPGTVLTMV